MSKQPLCIAELVPTTLAPVIVNGVISTRANVTIIQNAGNILVKLGDGWTMRPGEKIQFGAWESLVVLKLDLRVTFSGTSLIPDEADNPLVEVFEMKVANVAQLSDYVDK